MIIQSPQNPFSHFTAKERSYASFPTKHLYNRKLIKGRVLDFGCGLGKDVEFLKSKNFEVTGYDPFYFPNYPDGKYDTILCNYVLNVLFPEEQAHVLMAVSELLKPEGKAYYALRRDIKRSGFRYNPKHKCKTYQCIVHLPFRSILRTEHCEIYEYRHVNQIKSGGEKNSCNFCNPGPETALLTESATAYALLYENDKKSKGIYIVPKKHTPDFFELSKKEQQACWIVASRIKNVLFKSITIKSYELKILADTQYFPEQNHVKIDMRLIFGA